MCACINRNVCKNIDAEIVEEGDDDEKINGGLFVCVLQCLELLFCFCTGGVIPGGSVSCGVVPRLAC